MFWLLEHSHVKSWTLRIGPTSGVRLNVDLRYTILNCQLHSDPNSLLHNLVVWIERFTAGQLNILVRHFHIAHVHGLSWMSFSNERSNSSAFALSNDASGIAVALVKRRSPQSRFSWGPGDWSFDPTPSLIRSKRSIVRCWHFSVNLTSSYTRSCQCTGLVHSSLFSARLNRCVWTPRYAPSTTGTITTKSRTATVEEPPTIFWTVLIVGTCLCVATDTSTPYAPGMIWSTFTISFTTRSTRRTTLCFTVRCWIRSCGISRTTSSILLSDLRNVLRNYSTVSCCTRQRVIWWGWRFLPTLGTGTSTGIVRTMSTIFAMTCGNIQSSPASASYRLDTTTKVHHFAYIVNFSPDVPSFECVSSLAYSNIPWPLSLGHLPATSTRSLSLTHEYGHQLLSQFPFLHTSGPQSSMILRAYPSMNFWLSAPASRSSFLTLAPLAMCCSHRLFWRCLLIGINTSPSCLFNPLLSRLLSSSENRTQGSRTFVSDYPKPHGLDLRLVGFILPLNHLTCHNLWYVVISCLR